MLDKLLHFFLLKTKNVIDDDWARPVLFTSFQHEVVTNFLICMSQFLCHGSITLSLATMNITMHSFKSIDPFKQV
jgi:hypothetical protein